MTRSNAVPPGWDENPTTYSKRRRLIVLAFAGLCVASYLTLYRLGIFTEVWVPIFPKGSPKVLHLMEPFPDASPGALAHMTEVVLSFIAGEDRWRTALRTVLALGFVILCGAVVSVLLVIAQLSVVSAWRTLCLTSAFLSFVIFSSGVKEPLAAIQHLERVRTKVGSVWRALWRTGNRHA